MPATLQTADRYYGQSATLAARAASRARRATTVVAAGLVVAQHQAAQALEAQGAVTAMLAEQGIRAEPEATLNPLAFTTTAERFAAMVEQAEVDWQFNRLVASLVQDAGRAAQGVSIASRPEVAHVRHLNTPSCSRCAVLAGRVYRYSEGFLRHPGCDCVMIPTTVASPDLTYDPAQMARDGQIAGLSRADTQALSDGADLSQIVNVRRKSAGLAQSGEALTRAGRPTPAGIYRMSSDRTEALSLLQRFGYVR